MNTLVIGKTKLNIKDYYCSRDNGVVIPNASPKLWLYINLTNVCPGKCSFCVNPYIERVERFNLVRFRKTLKDILPHISGISITGGEPTMDIPLLDEVVESINEIVTDDIELDLVTNGLYMDKLIAMNNVGKFTTIHISRHMVDDEANRKVFGLNVPTEAELMEYMKMLDDPYAIVFNCVLRKDGVKNIESVKEFLEMAARIGVSNTSFIGMFPANDYCKEQYVNPGNIDFKNDDKFRILSCLHDFDYCNCITGIYLSDNGYTRFYCRWPGQKCHSYCRQLVYDSDNRLLDGFFGNVISL